MTELFLYNGVIYLQIIIADTKKLKKLKTTKEYF